VEDIKLVDDFEESEYNLTNIGLSNLFLVFEYDLIYFYNDSSNFYFEIDNKFIENIMNTNIIIRDDEVTIAFNEEQSDIIRNIFKDVIDAKYRGRLTKEI